MVNLNKKLSKLKPFWQFFHVKFYDYRKTDRYKKGIRSILSIEYELPCCSLLSDDEVWKCPIISGKIIFGWLMINLHFPWGRITKSSWGPINRSDYLKEYDVM